jgi:hypothetical protein
MRSTLFKLLASVASTLALLHCVDAVDPGPAPVTPPSEAGVVTAPTADGGAEAAPRDAGTPLDAADAGRCSADHWCRTPLPTQNFDLQAVWAFAPDDAFAVGAGGMIHWDGKSWSAVDGGDAGVDRVSSLWASGPNDLWAVGAGEPRLVHGSRASNGKLVWSSYDMGAGVSFQFITGRAPSDLWITGFADDGTQVLEHGVLGDAGPPTLSPVAVGVADFWIDRVYVSPDDDLWVTGSVQGAASYAAVAHGAKNGSAYTWDLSLSTEGQPYDSFVAISGVSASEIWILGSRTDNYHRSLAADGGAAWTAAPSHANTALAALWGSAKDDFWAVGYFGAVRHWDGKTWSISPVAVNGVPMYEHLAAIHGSSANDIWAVGAGVALHRTLGGTQ